MQAKGTIRAQQDSAARHSPATLNIAGVIISNAERPIVAAPGHTKLDVVRYHETMGEHLVREIAPRPIAVVKCMDGLFEDCFFQKHPLRERDDDDDDDL